MLTNIKEQNINFNPEAAKTSIPKNPQLDNASKVMQTVTNLIQGQVKQTPEEFEKALIVAFTPFGVKNIDDAYKVLEKFGFKKQDQQNDLNKTNQQNNTQETSTQNTPNTPKASDTAYSSMPKA